MTEIQKMISDLTKRIQEIKAFKAEPDQYVIVYRSETDPTVYGLMSKDLNQVKPGADAIHNIMPTPALQSMRVFKFKEALRYKTSRLSIKNGAGIQDLYELAGSFNSPLLGYIGTQSSLIDAFFMSSDLKASTAILNLVMFGNYSQIQPEIAKGISAWLKLQRRVKSEIAEAGEK